MAISISTLNNESAVSKTFVEIAKDRNTAEWINDTDSTATKKVRLTIKQSLLGKTKTGTPIRRALVQLSTTGVDDGSASPESMVINVTITGPEDLTVLAAADRSDAMAYLRNFLTYGNVNKLARGEV